MVPSRRSSPALASCPPAPGSGTRLRCTLVLAVGFDDDLARACARAAGDEGVGLRRVAQGMAAARAIAEWRPDVIAVGPSLWRDEVRTIVDAAQETGAVVVHVSATTPREQVPSLVMSAALE